MLIAGIDEAGYGPLLGPLVISGVAMTIPDELDGLSLWHLFADAISENAKKSGGKFVIADSKKLFRKAKNKSKSRKNLYELERSALGAAILSCAKENITQSDCPEDIDKLMTIISLEPKSHLNAKWYSHRKLHLPLEVDKQSLILSANILRRELKSLASEFTGVYTIPLFEKRYNEFAKAIKNKSQILFSQTARIVANIINNTAQRKIKIFIDKQGARNSYLNNLLRIFETWHITVIKESDEISIYRLEQADRSVEIRFTRNGEKDNMLTAWASIVSKYVRELFMIQFNEFWIKLDTELKPTAGYWQDGQRFIKDIAPLISKMQIGDDELIRQL